MTNLKTDDIEVKKSIIEKHFPKGRENALHQKTLADNLGIEAQHVKELAQKGREYGVPVLSDRRGYWISDDSEEILSFIKKQEKYGRTCFKSVKPLKELLNVLTGQKTITEGVKK